MAEQEMEADKGTTWGGLVDQTKEKFSGLKEGWKNFLGAVNENPDLQAALITSGMNLLQNRPQGMSGGQQLAASIGSGLEAASAYQQQMLAAELGNMKNQQAEREASGKELYTLGLTDAALQVANSNPWASLAAMMGGGGGGDKTPKAEPFFGRPDVVTWSEKWRENISGFVEDKEKDFSETLKEIEAAGVSYGAGFDTAHRNWLKTQRANGVPLYANMTDEDIDRETRRESPFRLNPSDQQLIDLLKKGGVSFETNKDGTYKTGSARLKMGALDQTRLARLLGQESVDIAPAMLDEIGQQMWAEESQKKAAKDAQAKLDKAKAEKRSAARATARDKDLGAALGGSQFEGEVPWLRSEAD